MFLCTGRGHGAGAAALAQAQDSLPTLVTVLLSLPNPCSFQSRRGWDLCRHPLASRPGLFLPVSHGAGILSWNSCCKLPAAWGSVSNTEALVYILWDLPGTC